MSFRSILRTIGYEFGLVFGFPSPDPEIRRQVLDVLKSASTDGRTGLQINAMLGTPEPVFYRVLCKMVNEGKVIRVLTGPPTPGKETQFFYHPDHAPRATA